jgi:hypothetical protein
VEILIWIGIALCLAQSAIFSGLNLAFFSLSRLRLEAEAATGSPAAVRVLALRRDSHFLLTTILWGNVGINVLLTLLSNSLLTGLAAFLFSTMVITLAGEIAPQAYFSRRAMKVASSLSPLMSVYQYLLYPVAKPTAWVLDRWLGVEGIELMRERQITGMIEQHIEAEHGDVDFVEGRGALNFLEIDDVPIRQEGEPVDPTSVIELPIRVDLPTLPGIGSAEHDAFVQRVNSSGRKWVILADPGGEPRLLLDSDGYLRAVLVEDPKFDGYAFCHRPLVVRDAELPLGEIIAELKSGLAADNDSAILKDIVLLWTPEHKRVVTGADILGRLLRGIG